MNNKLLMRANFVIVAYFVILYAFNYFKVDFVIVGVFREILTIPFLLAQVVFLFLSFRFLVKENKLNFSFGLSLVLLIVCSVLTIGSFF